MDDEWKALLDEGFVDDALIDAMAGADLDLEIAREEIDRHWRVLRSNRPGPAPGR